METRPIPLIGKSRKSVKLSKEEIKALKNFCKGFHAFIESAEVVGVSTQVLNRVIAFGSGSPETIEKVRKVLQSQVSDNSNGTETTAKTA